jgi:hypothetical protein
MVVHTLFTKLLIRVDIVFVIFNCRNALVGITLAGRLCSLSEPPNYNAIK